MRGRLDFVCVPSVDVISLPQEKGRLLSQALGDFLKNALVHGGHRVEIKFWVDEQDTAHMQVCDDGPGFDASVLNDPLTSLNALQRRAVAAGGDLRKVPGPEPACLRLTLPIRGRK
jgi:signal transduction histidine kinase